MVFTGLSKLLTVMVISEVLGCAGVLCFLTNLKSLQKWRKGVEILQESLFSSTVYFTSPEN